MTYEQAVALAARTSLATPLAQREAVIEALRELAAEMEHGAEYFVNRTLRWSPARQAENNRLISQARDLNRRADLLDPTSFACRAAQQEASNNVS